MRFVLLVILPLLATGGCSQVEAGAAPQTARNAAAIVGAPPPPPPPPPSPGSSQGSSAVAQSGGANAVAKADDLLEYKFSYPAVVGRTPQLARLIEGKAAKVEAETRRMAAADRSTAKESSYTFRTYYLAQEWEVVADLPGWLSLSNSWATYTGGAHGISGMESLVWDKQAGRAMDGVELFTSPAALGQALGNRYCRALDAQRREKRGDMQLSGAFADCPKVENLTVLVGSSNGRTFDRLTLYAGPYVAGSIRRRSLRGEPAGRCSGAARIKAAIPRRLQRPVAALAISRRFRYMPGMTQYQVIEAGETGYRDGTIKLHGPEGFEGMRRAGRLVAEILDAVADMVEPGVTTAAIDDRVREMMLEAGATVPATLGYRGYTHSSSCISINHVVCHGIPADKALKEGDIVNIDVTPILDGWHGDSSRMYLVGDVPLKARRLVDITYECLMLGIEQARPGNRLGDIGAAIQRHAERHRYGVVRDFCGHGLGRLFHDAPEVIHAAKAGTGPELKPGMFFTIEPMINLGRPHVKLLSDGWTAVTRDKSLSAQFEHSIGITEDGCEIFTLSPKGYTAPPYG